MFLFFIFPTNSSRWWLLFSISVRYSCALRCYCRRHDSQFWFQILKMCFVFWKISNFPCVAIRHVYFHLVLVGTNVSHSQTQFSKRSHSDNDCRAPFFSTLGIGTKTESVARKFSQRMKMRRKKKPIENAQQNINNIFNNNINLAH